jgi:cation diffusion facilitator family transporter
MITLLSKLFIKDPTAYGKDSVRRAYGMLCSIVGIFLNIILFAGKYLAGFLSGSIAITADAFNNLSDAGSSIITLIGFRFAGMKPDRDHPFGHGRIEYIAGFAVSALILIMGFELGSQSVQKIISPSPVDTGLLPILILVGSVCIKLYMYFYNRSIAKKIGSAAMSATATDSISDAVATSVVLLSALVARFTELQIDGWCGLLVAAFILFAGYSAARDTLSPLLGQAPDPEFVKQIEDIVMSHPEIVGIHDLIVHDYGPGRVMISLHGEVSAKGDLLVLHDAIDTVERELQDKLGCSAVIHMDPIACDDEAVMAMRDQVAQLAKEIHPSSTIHDFRIVTGPTHTNLIFDIVVPPDLPLSDTQIQDKLQELVQRLWENCFTVVTVDKSYI